MQLTFKEIKDDKDITELSQLAHKIWNNYYPPIIGQKQVDYMLAQIYSYQSLKDQIFEKQNIIWGAYEEGKMISFISYSKTGEKDFFIHKLYVDTDIHRKGIGRTIFEHTFKNKDLNTARLTVNRHNIKAINFYFRLGFSIEKVIDIDIGEGFFMHDFVMLLQK